jgi:predicted ATP-grasp superfamily ATP-dependent carboligase
MNFPSMQKVLILDGNQRSALAATRALGRRGIPVAVADACEGTLAGSSRYSAEAFVHPSPDHDPEGFIAALKEETAARGIGVIFPMTDVSTHLLLKHRSEFADISIPFGSFDAFETLTDKQRLCRLAQDLGISIPATHVVERVEQVAQMCKTLDFPVVLKPSRSKIWRDGRWMATSVKYAATIREAEDIVGTDAYGEPHPFLAQEYIRGEAQGIFALCNHGEPVVFFAHRRLREKPPSGGVSVLSESMAIDAGLKDITRRILGRVRWHGVAMVEFKVAPDGTPYLIEVNARFWGSLQLAVDAGVNFPYLLYQMATGDQPDTTSGYRVGVKSRWLLGDLDHLYLTFTRGSGRHLDRRSRWRTLLQFLRFFDKQTRYDVNRWDDWSPFLVELRQYRRSTVGTF